MLTLILNSYWRIKGNFREFLKVPGCKKVKNSYSNAALVTFTLQQRWWPSVDLFEEKKNSQLVNFYVFTYLFCSSCTGSQGIWGLSQGIQSTTQDSNLSQGTRTQWRTLKTIHKNNIYIFVQCITGYIQPIKYIIRLVEESNWRKTSGGSWVRPLKPTTTNPPPGWRDLNPLP